MLLQWADRQTLPPTLADWRGLIIGQATAQADQLQPEQRRRLTDAVIRAVAFAVAMHTWARRAKRAKWARRAPR